MKVGTEKSLIPAFYVAFFDDVMKHVPEFASLHLDLAYILKRYESEGLSFVTLTLPKLGKAVETSLITLNKLVTPMGFELMKGERLPKLLNCLFKTLWDSEANPLFDIRDLRLSKVRKLSYNVLVIRQVLLAFSKVEDCGCIESDDVAMSNFRNRVTAKPVITASSILLNRARELISGVVMEGDNLCKPLSHWVIEPYGRHGPGAVFGRECGREKWNFSYIPGIDDRLYSWSGQDRLDREESTTGWSRATVVPKDFKSRRIICIEPKEFQFAQQGLWETLRYRMHTHPLTRDAISFDDQSMNFNLSRDYTYATIDLKDASDRVSIDLCRVLFPKPFFRIATRYRARKILINDEDLVGYRSLATMGSAVCFPLETLVFWFITRATLELGGYSTTCRVFGDDIICPKEAFDEVIESLCSCGFVVNESKSCNDSLIRESCGSYFWCGDDIRIVRFGYTASTSKGTWIPFADYSRSFLRSGFEAASRAILNCIETVHPVPYGYLGFPDGPIEPKIRRYNKALQRLEVKVLQVCGPAVADALPGSQGMYAWLVGNDTHPLPRVTVKNRIKGKWIAAE